MDLPGPATAVFTEAGAGTDPLRANYGLHVGDDPLLVRRRRADLAHRVGRDIVWMDQTHSTRVLTVCPGEGRALVTDEGGSPVDVGPLTGVHPGEWGPLPCDGVVIDGRDWAGAPAAAVMVADCLPVLLADLAGDVVAAVHAGRAGLAGGILSRAVAVVRRLLAGDAELHALIGPCVCGGCYEVPPTMRDEVAAGHPAARSETTWGTPSLDLAAGAAEELRGLGVGVEVLGRCTREDPLLHSHRRDPRSGRQVGVVVPRRVGDMPGSFTGAGTVLH